MESSNCVEHNTSTAQQTDGVKDAASGDTAENQEEEVGTGYKRASHPKSFLFHNPRAGRATLGNITTEEISHTQK